MKWYICRFNAIMNFVLIIIFYPVQQLYNSIVALLAALSSTLVHTVYNLCIYIYTVHLSVVS